jgi:hypothetical protein
VENKLLVAFQRLARYPGVDEKDLNTLEIENELSSKPEIPEDGSRFDAGVGWDISADMLSTAFSGMSFATSTGASSSGSDTSSNSCESASPVSCVFANSSSCEPIVGPSTLWLLLKVGAYAGSEDRVAKLPIPNAAIS